VSSVTVASNSAIGSSRSITTLRFSDLEQLFAERQELDRGSALITSTILTLLVLPSIYMIGAARRARRIVGSTSAVAATGGGH